MSEINIDLNLVDLIVTDFDGVLTNNKVYVGEDGCEIVRCDRSDGLAFDVLKKLNIPIYILSTEKNKVVQARANKLNIPVYSGVYDKMSAINDILEAEDADIKRTVYIGNDLNDFGLIEASGISVCPADSHDKIKELSDVCLEKKGGDGVIRELVERCFRIDVVEVLY